MLRALDAVGLGRTVMAALAGRFPSVYERAERNTFRGYEPASHDVFVAVYPKAGNNWTMQLAVQIAYRGAAEFEHVHDLVAWPHAPVPELVVPMSARTHERSPTGLRVIKTQMRHPATPYNERAHYLVLLRDPKDVLVSMYHFVNGVVGGLVDVTLELDDLYAAVLDGRFPVCWAEHAASWWALRERDNVLVVTFAEMKQDLEGVARRAAAVMGVTLTEPELARVVERCSFAWMKAHEDQFTPPIPTYRGSPATMIRKGAIGESRSTLSSEQCATLDQHYLRKLAELRSALPYDQLFGD